MIINRNLTVAAWVATMTLVVSVTMDDGLEKRDRVRYLSNNKN